MDCEGDLRKMGPANIYSHGDFEFAKIGPQLRGPGRILARTPDGEPVSWGAEQGQGGLVRRPGHAEWVQLRGRSVPLSPDPPRGAVEH